MQPTLTLLTALMLALLNPGGRASAATPIPEETTTAEQWMQNVLLGDKPGKPFSFIRDRRL